MVWSLSPPHFHPLKVRGEVREMKVQTRGEGCHGATSNPTTTTCFLLVINSGGMFITILCGSNVASV